MGDISLSPLVSGYNTAMMNNNLDILSNVINDHVLHLDGGNNIMRQALDMNSNSILNLPAPAGPSYPVRQQDLADAIAAVIALIGSGSGEGSVTINKTKTVDDYGADPTGVLDSGPAFRNMLAELGYIYCSFNKKYRIVTKVEAIETDLVVYLNNSTILADLDDYVFSFYTAYTNQQAVSSITSEAIALGSGTSVVSGVVVADVSQYQVGQLVKIMSDDLLEGGNPSANETRGECFNISSIDVPNSKIYSYSSFREVYTTNVQVWTVNTTRKCVIRDGFFDAVRGKPDTYNQAVISVIGAYKPLFANLACEYSYSEFIKIQASYAAQGNNLRIGNLQTASSLFRYGYGIVEYSCEYGIWTNLFGYSLRHLYTTGVVGLTTVTTAGMPWNRGRTAFSKISNSIGFNCGNGAFSTHADAYQIEFSSCSSIAPYSGPSGGAVGFAIRGLRNTVRNCSVYGNTIGITTFAEYNSPNNGNETLIENFRYNSTENSEGTNEAISVNGKYAGYNMNCTIVNPIINGAENSAFLISVQYAKVRMVGGVIYAPQKQPASSPTSACRVIEIGAEANLSWDGGCIDYRGALGTALRTVRFTADGGAFSWKNGSVISTASEDWKYLVDFNHKASLSSILGLDVTLAPTDSDYTLNGEVATGNIIDFRMWGGIFGGNYAKDVSTGLSSTTIDFKAAGAERLSYVHRITTGSCTITAIARSFMHRQQLVITNRYDSTGNLTIKHDPTSGGTHLGGADIVIPPGKSLLLIWYPVLGAPIGGYWTGANI